MIQSKGRLLNLDQPVVMGILNATPDSFYNRGRRSTTSELVDSAAQMVEAGATVLDIGGSSTKPGSEWSSLEVERSRVLPVISGLREAYPDIWISVDTYHSVLAEEAVNLGADIVNDVTAGGFDANMLPTVARLQVPFVAMHIQGSPQTMQENPEYNNVVMEVFEYLQAVFHRCRSMGIRDVILDPGFGFGKTDRHNFRLLESLSVLRAIGCPILAGLSRKSMVCRTLGISPDEALNGASALHMAALLGGASVLRVHDVREAIEVVRLYTALIETAGPYRL